MAREVKGLPWKLKTMLLPEIAAVFSLSVILTEAVNSSSIMPVISGAVSFAGRLITVSTPVEVAVMYVMSPGAKAEFST